MKRKPDNFIGLKKTKSKNLGAGNQKIEDVIENIISRRLSLSRIAAIGLPPNYIRKGGEKRYG